MLLSKKKSMKNTLASQQAYQVKGIQADLVHSLRMTQKLLHTIWTQDKEDLEK
jgi:hypothetical protein